MKNTFFILTLFSFLALSCCLSLNEIINKNKEFELLGNSLGYVNPIKDVRKDVVDLALSMLPSRENITEEKMLFAMVNVKQSYYLTKIESAYFVYKWIAKNIAYDCYNTAHSPLDIDETEAATYNNGTGVGKGIASLFQTMANALGVTVQDVEGYVKGSGFIPGVIPLKSNHHWNAIEIDSTYYLIDATWGSGYCNLDEYVPQLKDAYFCINPEYLIGTHFPIDEKYKLISSNMTLEEFIIKPKLDLDFFENGFKTVYPELYKISTDSKIIIKFIHDNYQKMAILTNLYYYPDNSKVEQHHLCWVDRQDDESEIICYLKYAGDYKIKIYGGPASSEDHPLLVEYDIVSTENAAEIIEFPEVYNLYFNSDMNIRYPTYNPLYRGSFINFRFNTTTFNNLYIINNNHYRELEYVDGLFITDDVFIFAQEVYVATLIDGEYKNIVKYSTVLDPDKESEPTFPISYKHNMRSMLYSPIMSSLKIGETYIFTIRCDDAKKIAVLEGDTFTYLTKEESGFTGKVKVNGTSKTVNIIQVFETSYNTLYRYEVYE